MRRIISTFESTSSSPYPSCSMTSTSSRRRVFLRSLTLRSRLPHIGSFLERLDFAFDKRHQTTREGAVSNFN